jgi:hypothetical protein
MRPKAIKTALKNLQKESKTLTNDKSKALDHAYKQAVERIERQEAGFQELAKQVLSWITCAKRPLTTLELRHALAVEIGDSELDEDNLPEIEDMVSVCVGLVTVDEESNIIRLVHYTTQEYFERTWTSWFSHAQTDITKICVTYLSFIAFESGFCPTDEEFKARLRSHPLYNYAAQNWGHHARAASTEVEQMTLNLLESEQKVSASSQAMITSIEYSNYSQREPTEITGVHLAAFFGLKEAMVALLKNGHHLDCKDTYRRTPLYLAAGNGHEAVVKLLLDKGADPDSRDKYGKPRLRSNPKPLLFATVNGHEAVVKLLLEKGAEPNSEDKYGRTPLYLAAGNGHEALVKLLLDKGAEPNSETNSEDEDAQTPLLQAAGNGHEAIVKLLQSHDSQSS